MESNIANGVQPNGAYAGQPRIIWRTPKLGRALGRNSACLIVPRRDFGCSRQRKRANNKRPAGRKVGRFFIFGRHSKTMDPALMAVAGQQPDTDRYTITSCHKPIAIVLDLMIQLEPDGGLSAGDGRQGSMKLAQSAARRLRIRSTINMPYI